MIDRYLFRGKRTDNGEWIYGNYCYAELIDKSGYEDLIIEQPADGETRRVIPETVGQYTGLKDKNSKMIFEGDIVIYERDEEVGQIEYHENEAMFVVEFDTWLTDFDHMYGKDLEVIGNIHDNPELLEV